MHVATTVGYMDKPVTANVDTRTTTTHTTRNGRPVTKTFIQTRTPSQPRRQPVYDAWGDRVYEESDEYESDDHEDGVDEAGWW